MTRFPSILANIAAMIHPRSRSERREVKRLQTPHVTPCQFQAPEAPGETTGWVYDLSVKGVGIIAGRAVPPGTTLRTLLINSGHTFALAVDVKVVRCLRAAHGNFLLGGEFTRRLDHAELVPFIV